MKKREWIIPIAFILFLYILAVTVYPLSAYKKTCQNYHPNSPPYVDIPIVKAQVDGMAQKYGLSFEFATEEDKLETYSIRTTKYLSYTYRESMLPPDYGSDFYDIPIKKHPLELDFIDKEHKIAIIGHLSDIGYYRANDSMIPCTNRKVTEEKREQFVKQGRYLVKTTKKIKDSWKVKEPFQQEGYTVIYADPFFFLPYKGAKDGIFIPYLEKAFESLGYTKKE